MKRVERENIILKEVLNCVDLAVQIVNKEGITIFYNKVAAEMDGLEQDEVLCKHILEVYPSLTIESSTLLKVLETKKPIINKQQTVVNHKGRTSTMLFCTYPIFDGDEIVGACDVSRDITKVKMLSEQLLDLQAQLLGKNSNLEQIQKSKEKVSGASYTLNDIIGQDSKMIKLKIFAQRVAQSSSPILVYGETGTGKELLVHSIHNASPLCNGPFIAQNCAALPATLLESILFGTVTGSFTGAEDRKGLFELANNGTLFLDEINSMPIELQSKLLRLLQEGSLRRVGDSRLRRIEVRVITCTNIEPMEAVKQKALRLDLYYRLNVVSLKIPPLRERPTDILLLVRYFIDAYNKKFNLKVLGISDRVEEIFKSYSWPGNVRELQHCIEHAMNIVDGPLIKEKDLPFQMTHIDQQKLSLQKEIRFSNNLPEEVKALEKKLIVEAMNHYSWNVSKAANYLHIPRQTLQYKLKIYQIYQGSIK